MIQRRSSWLCCCVSTCKKRLILSAIHQTQYFKQNDEFCWLRTSSKKKSNLMISPEDNCWLQAFQNNTISRLEKMFKILYIFATIITMPAVWHRIAIYSNLGIDYIPDNLWVGSRYMRYIQGVSTKKWYTPKINNLNVKLLVITVFP